jgi:hypothetical protein
LATGEIQAQMQRAQKMQAMQGGVQGEQPSVKEQIEQKAGLMGLQQAQQRMAQQQQMTQRPPAGPVPEGTPEPEMQPAPEMMMARGGLAQMPVRFNYDGGGIVAFSGKDDSDVKEPETRPRGQGTVMEQGAAWEARRQAAREAKAKEDEGKTSIAGDAYRGLLELAKRMGTPVAEGFDNLSERQKIRQQMEENRQGLFEALSPDERAARQARSKELLNRLNQLVEPTPVSGSRLPSDSVSEAQATTAAGPQAAVPPVGLPAALAVNKPNPVTGQRPIAGQRPVVGQPPAANQNAPQAAMPTIPGLGDPAAQAAVTTALKAPDQASLIAEDKARREAMGITGRGGEDQEARIKATRDLYEKSRPSGLDDAIRVFGQAGQFKGLSGTGPAYTAMQTQKRAEDLKMQQQEAELLNAVDTARRTEGIAGANKVGDTLGKMRDTAATTGASVLGHQMTGNVSLANQASSNATQMQIAKDRNLNSIEVAKIQAASANRPGETERMMATYGDLKSKDPKAAEDYMRSLERIRGAGYVSRGVMTRDQAEDNVRKDLENFQVGPKLVKDATEALKTSGITAPTMIQIKEYLVQQNMKSNSPSASSGKVPPPPAGFKPD